MLRIGINGRSIFRQLTGVQHYAGGISRALSALQAADVEFIVFAGREGRRSREPGLTLKAGRFPAGGPSRGIIWEQALLRRMARKARVDLLFNPANMAPLDPPVPSVVTIHDLAFLLFPRFFSRTFARYYRAAIPRVARQARAVITDSESARADLVERLRLPEEKVSVVPLGVSPRFKQRPAPEKREEVRRRYRLPDRFFLSLSSQEPRKNLARIVRAYRMLPEEITGEYGLVLAGGGGHVFADTDIPTEIRRIKTGKAVATGRVPDDDLVAIYHMASSLVYPSLYEGFGLPVLEAMAAGTPVVTSNRSSLPEVAGRAAALVDPESVEELAAAMELIATDSGTANLLIERGRKRASEFTWEVSAQKTLEILRRAAAG